MRDYSGGGYSSCVSITRTGRRDSGWYVLNEQMILYGKYVKSLRTNKWDLFYLMGEGTEMYTRTWVESCWLRIHQRWETQGFSWPKSWKANSRRLQSGCEQGRGGQGTWGCKVISEAREWGARPGALRALTHFPTPHPGALLRAEQEQEKLRLRGVCLGVSTRHQWPGH